jgi:D-threonine aldolase
MTTRKEWYIIDDITELDTPALVIYPDRVKKNIHKLIKSIDDMKRLRPHIKTHKSSEVTTFMLEAGIRKFKCATIAEAEMLALAGAPDVLLAYQPVGPKASRLAALVKQFPATRFTCLIDNVETAAQLSEIFQSHSLSINVFIDLNVGMNRTGIVPEEALELIENCKSLPNILVIGLHAYDGHIRDSDIDARTKNCNDAFSKVQQLQQDVKKHLNQNLTIIAGGTPTYPIHARRKDIECSPGTFVYWDEGYEEILAEQPYLFAALVVTRVISKPSADSVCIDLGHKAIAAENPLLKRVRFLNAEDLKPTGQSEEHMTLHVTGDKVYAIGDVLYGVPYHVCPTVALHDHPVIIEDHHVTGYWTTLSRNRKITV